VVNQRWEEPVNRAKPFEIPKREIWEAYKRVRANHGAAGVDGQSIAEFEVNLADNLYKLWNRMSSGSYFPPPVRRVELPKDDGGTRLLGIPTVADRVAHMVVKRFLEPLVEPKFHRDSYGYIGPASRRSKLLAWRASVAGVTRGCSIWISRPFSTASIELC
jgi:hypothetical protein